MREGDSEEAKWQAPRRGIEFPLTFVHVCALIHAFSDQSNGNKKYCSHTMFVHACAFDKVIVDGGLVANPETGNSNSRDIYACVCTFVRFLTEAM